MTTEARPHTGGPRNRLHLSSSALAWGALVILLACAGAFLLHETRGTTLWFDEWSWAFERRGGGLASLLEPHNEHLSLLPVAIYKVLFATAGLESHLPYRAMVIAGHLACTALLFAYVRQRAGDLLGLLAAALLLFLGPGWHNILWPFQVGTLLSLAAGVGSLLLLDRRDRAGYVGACALLAVSLMSSGIGLVFAAGVLVELRWSRARRLLWVAVAPLLLYVVWWLAYQEAEFVRHNIVATPRFAADAAAGVVAALTGLAGEVVSEPGSTLEWGAPIALVATAALAWRLTRLHPLPARVLALLTMLVGFWVLTGLRRASISNPDESRYLYVGAFVALLLIAELLRGVSLPRTVMLVVGVAVGAALLSNIGILRSAAREQRAQADQIRAELGVLEVAEHYVNPDYVLGQFPGYPLVVIPAGEYLETAKELGSPAAGPAEITKAPEPVRAAADAELIRMDSIALQPTEGQPASGQAPAVDAVAGGSASARGACVTFRRAVVDSADPSGAIDLTVPPTGLILAAEAGPAAVQARRFASSFSPLPQGTLAASASAFVRVRRDLASQPWHIRVAPEQRVTVCAAA